ncbi:uncharacterized protein RCC_10989 [Ramularia collo-cygni]|uniref:Uncharacterized protein n=1 Tax=Ramularia collo-cygni TaxID=112498 RepID=A0A2D3VDT2_9PEZI|nr:uncharacterized protein RCC_10989 [Ramularia collo-cygni]CZT25260.1 uncharacterized protein RCC_10989 [Ramularia collo-cygni]
MAAHTPDSERRTSSEYSGVPSTPRRNLNGNGIGNPFASSNGHSRPSSNTPYVPSYMSHIPSRSQASNLSINVPKSPASSQQSAVELPANEVSIGAPRGQLLLLAAGTLHQSLLSYIELLVTRQPFSGIILVGSHDEEAALKALKMNCFALIGRLSKEMSVSVYFQDQWTLGDMEATLQQITKTGEGIQGVICCPDTLPEETDSRGVLAMSGGLLQQAITRRVTFVESAIQVHKNHLMDRPKANSGNSSRAPRGPFFLVAGPPALSAASQIAKAASDHLLAMFNAALQAFGVTVAYAEDILIPDSVKVGEASDATSGPILQPAEVDATGQDQPQDTDYMVPESPTKLWALWSGAGNIE